MINRFYPRPPSTPSVNVVVPCVLPFPTPSRSHLFVRSERRFRSNCLKNATGFLCISNIIIVHLFAALKTNYHNTGVLLKNIFICHMQGYNTFSITTTIQIFPHICVYSIRYFQVLYHHIASEMYFNPNVECLFLANACENVVSKSQAIIFRNTFLKLLHVLIVKWVSFLIWLYRICYPTINVIYVDTYMCACKYHHDCNMYITFMVFDSMCNTSLDHQSSLWHHGIVICDPEAVWWMAISIAELINTLKRRALGPIRHFCLSS